MCYRGWHVRVNGRKHVTTQMTLFCMARMRSPSRVALAHLLASSSVFNEGKSAMRASSHGVQAVKYAPRRCDARSTSLYHAYRSFTRAKHLVVPFASSPWRLRIKRGSARCCIIASLRRAKCLRWRHKRWRINMRSVAPRRIIAHQISKSSLPHACAHVAGASCPIGGALKVAHQRRTHEKTRAWARVSEMIWRA